MPELQIIGGPQSNFVWATRIACAEKGVPYGLSAVMPHTPEVDAIHPFGKIPALRHGDFTLCELRAILTYIDKAFSGPPLFPADAQSAAKVDQWISIVSTNVDFALLRQYMRGYIFPGTPDGSPNRTLIDAALPGMQKTLAVVERAISSGHLVGNGFTMADAYLTPILYYMTKAPESGAVVKGSKSLSSYVERHMARPSIRDTVPPPFPSRG